MSGIQKRPPGFVRDAIISVLSEAEKPLSVAEIERNVEIILGPTPRSSIRSYLNLNTPGLFLKDRRRVYRTGDDRTGVEPRQVIRDDWNEPFEYQLANLVHQDCVSWLKLRSKNSIHAVVTDPPYGLHEYSSEQIAKLRGGKGGVWRIPPSFDGNTRAPLPRFTTLTARQLDELSIFFFDWGRNLLPVLVPGANVVVASNPLLSHLISNSLANAGLERRGEIVRLTMTMRGGDRPKNAHTEFNDVSVMPRSMWEPWLIFRKPLEGRVQDNLRKWKTGGFRRISNEKPFGDVIASSPTRKREREIAPHESLKPQAFLRQIVRAALPLGKGVILDPFAGSGSTLAAANVVGYESIGIERDENYFAMATEAIPKLTHLQSCDVNEAR
jgi:site-specific DNA-methyltransferase (adenine-specific)